MSLQVNEDNYHEKEHERLDLVSDAAVHVKARKVVRAWQLFNERSNKRRVALPLEHQIHSHSFRHEIETFYHALKDAEERLMFPHHIDQHMDCESGLTKLNAPITTPRNTMATYMNLVMAYKKRVDESKHTINRHWVMGHADVKKRDKPEEITPLQYDNTACDNEANECVSRGVPAHSFTSLPGYRAMLKLGDDWVTTDFRANIYFAHVAPAMKEYILCRLDIDARTFETID